MKVRSSDGVSVAYEEAGRGKPALVFVHGFCCDRSYWDAQVPYFVRRHRVVTIDLAGHGESGVGRQVWTGAAFGEDVVAVVSRLELEQVILVGHSMGGPVALEAAIRMPERVIGLVAVDTFGDIEQTRNREQTKALIASMEADFVGTMRQFVKDRFLASSDPILVEKVAADMSSAPPEVGTGIERDWFLTQPALASVFDKVRAPIRCVASDSNLVNVEAGRRHAFDFRVDYVPNVGHFVMMEDPATFNRILGGIVDELASTQFGRSSS